MKTADSVQAAAEPKSYTVEYLLNELTHHQAMAREVTNIGLQRVNIHIAIVSGSIALVAIFGQGLTSNTTLFLLVSLVFIGILFLGFVIYAEMVQWVMTMVYVHRVTGRLKRYFYDHDIELERYVGVPTDDRQLRVARRSVSAVINTDLGPKQIVTILNNVAALTASITLAIGVGIRIQYLIGLLGLLAFFVTWALQFYYARLRYRLTEQQNKWVPRFPRQLPENYTGDSPDPETEVPLAF